MPETNRRIRFQAIALSILGCLAVAGCSTSPPKGTPVFDAWGPDGSGGEFENPHQVMTSPAENGVIYRFEPGDVINLDVQVNGDIIRSDEPIVSVLRVQQPVWIHFGPNGATVSFDGKSWTGLSSAANGNISLEVSISEEDPRNQAFLQLRAEQR